MVNTEDLEPFIQQSDETLLARVEALEQEVEGLERRIETLEHIVRRYDRATLCHGMSQYLSRLIMKRFIYSKYLNPARGIYKQIMLSIYHLIHRSVDAKRGLTPHPLSHPLRMR